MSVSLDTDNETLNDLVNEVNTHRHTKSCRKGKSNCRFNFPRLPSRKTIIACPPSPNMTDRELNKHREVLQNAKDYLESLTEDFIENDLKNDIELFLKKLNVTLPEYEDALKVSE